MRMANTAGWALTALVVGCGGDTGPEGIVWNTEGLPTFCQEALAGVQAFVENANAESAPGPEYGGSATIGLISDIQDGMNAFVTVDYGSLQHQLFVNLMTLVRFDEELLPTPYLAERWELSDDGTELTFFLRQDVLWHDGTPTTAHDVAFTVRRASDPAMEFPNANYWAQYDTSADGIQVVDDYTIRFKLDRHPGYMDPWRAVAIMPAHLLETIPVEELRGHPYGVQCPVGNGPFVFTGRAEGSSWTFHANPAFPEALGGRPFLDRYVYRYIPDQNTLMAELSAGGIDGYIQPLVEQSNQIRDDPDLELLTFPFSSYAMVAWNGRRPELADRRVRTAIALATNRQQLLEVLRGGFGRIANATVPPSHWAYDPSMEEQLAYNPGEAEGLLTEAGWVDRNGDGVRENSEGQPLEVDIAYNTGNKERQDIAEIMQSQLGHVGIRVIVRSIDWGALIESATSPERDFDGVTLAWQPDFFIDDTDLFRSDKVDEPYAFSGTQNAEVDRLLRAIPAANDRDTLGDLLGEYQSAIVEEQPFTFLYYGDRVVGVNRRLKGVDMDIRGEWVNIRDWRIQP
ncbi:MAG: ABC transporter substrate-binding protein [Longimicrobiales bacterium]